MLTFFLVISMVCCITSGLTPNIVAAETDFIPRADGVFSGITDALEGTVVDLSDSQYIIDSYILPKGNQTRYVRIDTTDLNNDDTRIPAVIGRSDQSFDEHLTLHPGNSEAYVVLDVSALDCDHFYSAVGISADTGKQGNKGVVFTIYGYSEKKEMFEPIATSGDLYGYDTGEFHVDIAGYKKLKLSVSLTADSTDYNSRTVSWCDVSIYKSTKGSTADEGASIQIPEFVSSSGTALEPHYCGNENFELTYRAVNDSIYADMDAYEVKLQNAGYSLYARNNIGNNRIFTYVNGDVFIHCMYFDALKFFRIIYGPQTYLGPQSPITDHQKIVTPSVSIIGMTDSVLCLVLQLEDGSFVVIDGGYGNDETRTVTLNADTEDEYTFTVNRQGEKDLAALWDFLKENTPGGKRPQVTWMITHADGDHIHLPCFFIEKYHSEFDLNTVVYNFPNFNNIGLHSSNNPNTFTQNADRFVNTVKEYYPNANHFIYHTGQKLYLPGCDIEFFYCHEDYWPYDAISCNHTSGIWRFSIAGKTIMITGDCETSPNSFTAQTFGDYLKSDVLQVIHHGSNGGTLTFYRRVSPSVCLWPCLEEQLQYDRRRTGQLAGWEFNKYLHETAAAHYSGSTTTTLRLPSLEVRPDLTTPDYLPIEPTSPTDTASDPTVNNVSNDTEPVVNNTIVIYIIVIGGVALFATVAAVIFFRKKGSSRQR